MLTMTCLCGAVRVTVTERPDHVNACNCSLCSKAGAEWATYSPDAVAVAGATQIFRRADRAEPNADVHFCPTCGSTTHFTLTEFAVARHGNALMGVNMRLADPGGLAGVERRFPDGRAWAGEGTFGYARAAELIGS